MDPVKIYLVENFGHEWMEFTALLFITTKKDSLLLFGSQRNIDNLTMALMSHRHRVGKGAAIGLLGSARSECATGKYLRETHTALRPPSLWL